MNELANSFVVGLMGEFFSWGVVKSATPGNVVAARSQRLVSNFPPSFTLAVPLAQV